MIWMSVGILPLNTSSLEGYYESDDSTGGSSRTAGAAAVWMPEQFHSHTNHHSNNSPHHRTNHHANHRADNGTHHPADDPADNPAHYRCSHSAHRRRGCPRWRWHGAHRHHPRFQERSGWPKRHDSRWGELREIKHAPARSAYRLVRTYYITVT